MFANINDFHAWEAWSPWAKLDPNMTASYSGPTSGPGAAYAWNGNSDVGEPSTFVTKVMTTFVSMDKMIGPDFERGLQQLKAVSEK